MAIFGHDPMWAHQPLSLAEAAGVREEAEVVRLIEGGHDPNRRYSVRAGLIFDDDRRVTPLEAAVRAGDARMVQVLLAKGARMDEALSRHLRCLGAGTQVFDVVREHLIGSPTSACDGLTVP
jgi:hypothetical protein